MVVGVLDDLFGDGDIVLHRFGGGVDHDGGKTAVDTVAAKLIAVAVIQMQADGQTGLDDGGLHQLYQIGVVGIGAGTLGNLQDQRGAEVLGSFGDALDDLHIIHVERADGIPTVIRFFKHLPGGNKWHNDHLLNYLCQLPYIISQKYGIIKKTRKLCYSFVIII